MSNYSKHKDREPQDTIFNIQRILNEAGLFTTVMWSGDEVKGLRSNRVSVYPTTLGTNGKGTDELYCTASGYAEMLERIQNNIIGVRWEQRSNGQPMNGIGIPDLEYMSAAQIVEQGDAVCSHMFEVFGKQDSKEKADFLYKWTLSLKDTCDPDAIDTAPFVDVRNRRIVNLPVDVVMRVYGSNGMSAGNTIEEALVQGIAEVFERYANHMLVEKKYVPPRIPDEVLKSYSVWDTIQAIRATGRYDVVVLDCSLGKGLPVAGSMIIDKHTGHFGMKLGSHPSIAVAVERTLTESFQGRNKVTASSGCALGSEKEAQHYHNFTNIIKIGSGIYPVTMLADEPDWEFVPWTAWEGLDNRAYLQKMLHMLIEMGFSPMIRDAAHLGFPSCYIIVPGMSEMYRLEDLTLRIDATSRRNTLSFGRFPDCNEIELRRLLKMIRIKERSMIENELPVLVGRPLRDSRLVSETVAAYVALKLGEYGQARHYFNIMLQLATDEVEQIYLRCIGEYARYRELGVEHEKAIKVIRCMFDSEAVQRVEDETSDMERLLWKVFPHLNCFDCEHCELTDAQCGNRTELEVFAKMRKAVSQSTVRQEDLMMTLRELMAG